MIGKLCAKYQLCAVRTADNTDGKSRKSIVSEKSPSFRPARFCARSGQNRAGLNDGQGSHRLEKALNLKGCLEKALNLNLP